MSGRYMGATVLGSSRRPRGAGVVTALLLATSLVLPAAAGAAPTTSDTTPGYVVVVDGPTGAVAADRELGGSVQLGGNDQTFTVFADADGRTGHVTIPLGLSVGEHGSEVLAAGFRFYVSASRSCLPTAVSLRIDELEIVDGAPQVVAAAFDAQCTDGLQAAGLVRYASTTPVDALALPAGTPRADLLVDAEEVTREVVVRNLGTEPTAVGAASIVASVSPLTGGPQPGAGDWRVVADGCGGATLGRGEDCVVEVGFRATERGPRLARLAFDGAHLGVRSISLQGWGRVLPPAPPVLAVAETLGRVALTFGPPDTADTSVTAVIVRRRPVGGTWTDHAQLPPPISSHNVYVDRTAVPGTAYEYALVSDGDHGRGPQGAARLVPNRRADLLAVVDGTVPVGARGPGHPWYWFSVDDGVVGQQVYTPAPSPDGRWVVEARGWSGSSQLWKRPSIGTGAAVQLTDLAGGNLDPAWSPDGRTIAFTNVTGGKRSLWIVPAAGGTVQKVLDGVANPSWDRDGQHLVVEDHRASTSFAELLRVSLTGVARPIVGTVRGRSPAVSPDGRFLAFSVPSEKVATLVVRYLDREGQGLAWEKDHMFTEPAWSVDGRQVFAAVEQQPGTQSAKRGLGVFTVTIGDHGDPVVTRQGSEIVSIRGGSPAPRALGVHPTSTPSRTGPAPSLGFKVWQAPTGTTFTCSLDGAKAKACTSPWKGTGLGHGRHRLVVEAHEPSGIRTVTSHAWDVDATAPKVTVSAPTSRVTTTKRATVTYRATDASGVANHDVRYRVARFDGTFGAYVRPDTWQRTTATSRSVGVSRGREVCFSVRSRDTLGNRSAWSPERCAARPLDDRSLTASSAWSRGSGAAFLDGTITSTKRRGAELTRAEVRAKQVFVVATRCLKCGTADVYIGATRVGRLDLAAATTQRQQIIALPVQSKVLTGKLTIRVTSTDRTVAIDGVAFRRS